MSRQFAACIDAASREIARAIEPFLVAAPKPPNRLHECIASVIERHLAALPVAEPLPLDRDSLGRAVRDAWVERCKLKPNPRPGHLEPFECLSEFDQETDRCIGDAVVRHLRTKSTPGLSASTEAGRESGPQQKGWPFRE